MRSPCLCQKTSSKTSKILHGHIDWQNFEATFWEELQLIDFAVLGGIGPCLFGLLGVVFGTTTTTVLEMGELEAGIHFYLGQIMTTTWSMLASGVVSIQKFAGFSIVLGL